nr:hypothetical protein [Tanacetum cinerariifolium]
MILHDGDERLTLNMKHDTASYSIHPHRESANLINIFNVPSEDCLEDSVLKQQSSNPTFSLHKEITSPKFTDELALIPYPLDYDDNLTCDIESNLKEIELLLYQGEDSDLKDSIDQTDLANRNDYFVDPTPEMFTDEHAPDYSFPPRFDVYDDDFWKLKYDSFASQDFSRDDDLPSPDNEDKVKENQEKDKIGSKPDKNGKRGVARKSQKQLQSRKKEKLKKIQVKGPEKQIIQSYVDRRQKRG